MGEGRGPPEESPVHHGALYEHFWVLYPAQGYIGSALKVFCPLPYYQNTFYCTFLRTLGSRPLHSLLSV